MTIPGMSSHGLPPNNDWLVRWIKQIEKRVNRNAHARSLENAEIGEGGLTIDRHGGIVVIDPDTGTVVLRTGYAIIPDGSGRTQMLTVLTRDDGSLALACGDLGTVLNHPHQQALQWFDRTGHVVLADDAISGVGLANPYIPAGTFVDITPPTASTTSTTFVGMQWADCYQQHPRVTTSVLVQTDSDTTGEVRTTLDGVQVGATLSVPVGTFGQLTIEAAAWPSGHYTFGRRVPVQLEARVTGGSGSIGVRGLGFWGVQS